MARGSIHLCRNLFWKYRMRSLKQTALKPKKAGVQQCPIAWVGMWKIHQAVLAQEFFFWDTKFMLHVFHLHVSCMTYLKPTLWVNRRLNPSLHKGCSVRLEGSPVLSMATPKKSVFKRCLGGYSYAGRSCENITRNKNCQWPDDSNWLL